MHGRFIQVLEDCMSTDAYGEYVSIPSHHLTRLLHTFNAADRLLILRAVHDGFQTTTDDCTLDQFVAFVLHGQHEPRFSQWDRCADGVRLSELDDAELLEVAQIANGRSCDGIARVFSALVFRRAISPTLDAIGILNRTFSSRIGSTEQAAHLTGLLQQCSLEVADFEAQAKDVLADIRLLQPKRLLRSRDWIQLRDARANLVQTYRKDASVRQNIIETQNLIVSPSQLNARFDLDENATGLIVPKRKSIIVAKSMEEAIRKVEQDKSEIMQMSPRTFEIFMADLFRMIGFEVELTKCTRDGGADLICVKNLQGIPIKLAVEIKRYNDKRPIDVSLVRSFVGANQQFQANRLVYVTTSSYTKPARDFATGCAGHLLTLKDYAQIQEWCRNTRE